MVYKRLDPASDWDAYCDDNPDDPEQHEVPVEFWRYKCELCGTLDHEDTTVSKDCTFTYCNQCGNVVENEGDYDYDAFMNHLDEEEAEHEAEAERMM